MITSIHLIKSHLNIILPGASSSTTSRVGARRRTRSICWNLAKNKTSTWGSQEHFGCIWVNSLITHEPTIYFGLSPCHDAVTTIVLCTFRFWDPYKSSLATTTGKGDNPTYYGVISSCQYNCQEGFPYDSVPKLEGFRSCDISQCGYRWWR